LHLQGRKEIWCNSHDKLSAIFWLNANLSNIYDPWTRAIWNGHTTSFHRDINDVACSKAMETIRIWERRAAILGFYAFPIRASYSQYCVLCGADFYFCGVTLWKYKLLKLDAISNIIASNGWLIERMVPDASPGEACTGKQGKRMSGHDACILGHLALTYPCNVP
jgi:hypothetical protein